MNKTYIPERGSGIMKYHAKKQLSKEFNRLKNKKVLDFGCGPGFWIEVLRDIGIEPIGVDISKEHVEICKQKSLIAYMGDVKYLKKFKSNSFDGILCSFVVEHLDRKEIEILLNDFRRILKPKGLIQINTDDFSRTYKIFYNDYTHKTPFTPKSLEELMNSKGFKKLKVFRFPAIIKGAGFLSEFIPPKIIYPFCYLNNLCFAYVGINSNK